MRIDNVLSATFHRYLQATVSESFVCLVQIFHIVCVIRPTHIIGVWARVGGGGNPPPHLLRSEANEQKSVCHSGKTYNSHQSYKKNRGLP
jgi:hypothetical protein